jgi:hypothetical protein
LVAILIAPYTLWSFQEKYQTGSIYSSQNIN